MKQLLFARDKEDSFCVVKFLSGVRATVRSSLIEFEDGGLITKEEPKPLFDRKCFF